MARAGGLGGRSAVWLLAIVMGLVVTGCSRSSATIEIPARSTTAPPSSVSSTAVPSTTVPNSSATETSVSTSTTAPGNDGSEGGGDNAGFVSAVDRSEAALAAAAGGSYGKEEFGMTMEELTRRIEEVEQAIGACMAEAGFEYVPVDFSTVRKAMTSDKSAPGLTASQYLAQYGHGITTQPDKPIVRIGLGEQNRKIFDGLRPEDQVAYLHTLLGEDPNATFAFGLESENFSRTGGCTRTAIEQFYNPQELDAQYFNPADAYILADPRSQAALVEYQSCMADGGFPYAHPDDIDVDLQIRYDSITKGRDPAELTGPDAEALARLQAEELAVTAANQTCETTKLEPVLDRVQAELFGR